MTPERRAELREHLNEYGGGLCCPEGRELLAEIDALTAELAAKDKALDQATPIVQAYARHNPKTDTVLFGIQDPMGAHFWLKKTAELRKREGQ